MPAERIEARHMLTRRGFVAMTTSLAVLGDIAPAAAAQTHAAPPPTPRVAQHPLDPLSADEYAVIKALVRTRPELGPKTIYAWVQLREPSKSSVLAFVPGAALQRDAMVVALSPEHRTAYELVVDVTGRTVRSVTDLGNLQPFLTDDEFDLIDDVIDASPAVRDALAKRGYHFRGKISDGIYIDAYAPGHDPITRRDGKTIRSALVLFADQQGGINNYGPYLEGLVAFVDLYGRSVLDVRDAGGPSPTVKVPQDIFNPAVLGPRLPEADLRIAPATIKDLAFDGNRVRWDNWEFRYSFNQREGLVLHQIGYRDGGSARSICYRASVSEMLVPYCDPSPNWSWRQFFDSGEYGLGALSVPARPGKELPDNALALEVVAAGPTLDAETLADRVYFFERDAGALLVHEQEDGRRIYARAKELVVGLLATVGNYDYMFSFVFRRDGSFGFEATLQGLILNKTVRAVTQADATDRYGTLVSPQVMGITHQHWINLRLDFDIDGVSNAVAECNVVPIPQDPLSNPAGDALLATNTVFTKARDAARTIADRRSWLVFNPSKRSPLGHAAGFEIQPRDNTVSAIPPSRYGEPSSFVQRHFWATKYDADQLYAAGKYPNQYPSGYRDDLVHYAGEQSVYDEDVVVWYSMGFTHVTRPEDFPIMPAETLAVDFKPHAFFEKSPALPYARLDRVPLP